MRSPVKLIPNSDKKEKQAEFSFIVGRNVKWSSCIGREFGNLLQTKAVGHSDNGMLFTVIKYYC